MSPAQACTQTWLQFGVTHWLALAVGIFIGMVLCGLFVAGQRGDHHKGDRT